MSYPPDVLGTDNHKSPVDTASLSTTIPTQSSTDSHYTLVYTQLQAYRAEVTALKNLHQTILNQDLTTAAKLELLDQV
jgi:hypothetical protein